MDGFLHELRYEVQGKTKEVVYWLAELRDPNTPVTLSDEHQDYRWVPLKEACALAHFTDMQETLKAAQKYLEARQNQ